MPDREEAPATTKMPLKSGKGGMGRREADERWVRENLEAMKAWNEYVERNGIPYAEFRRD